MAVKDTVNQTWLIESVDEFKAFRDEVNNGATFEGWTVSLGKDINLSGEENFGTIGTDENYSFRGTFDGKDHTISNLKISSAENNVGLFGYIAGAEIKNFTLENAEVTGEKCTAAVVGNANSGTIENVTVTGTVKVTGTSSVGAVAGQGYAELTEITVNVAEDSGSFVKGNAGYIGGVMGNCFSGEKTMSDITSNISVIGESFDIEAIGGVFGYVGKYNTLEGIECTAPVLEGIDIKIQDIEKINGLWGDTAEENVTIDDDTCIDNHGIVKYSHFINDDANGVRVIVAPGSKIYQVRDGRAADLAGLDMSDADKVIIGSAHGKGYGADDSPVKAGETGTLKLTGNSVIEADALWVGGDASGDGIAAPGTSENFKLNVADGTIEVTEAQVQGDGSVNFEDVAFTAGTLTNSGKFAAADSTSTVSGSLTNSGHLSVSGGTFDAQSGVNNSGELSVAEDGHFTTNVLTNSGSAEFAGSSFSADSVDNTGKITVSGNSTLNIESMIGTIVAADGTTLTGSTIKGGTGYTSVETNGYKYVLSVNGSSAGTLNFAGESTIQSIDAGAGDIVNVKGATLHFVSGNDGFKLGNGATWNIEDAKVTNYGWALSLDGAYMTDDENAPVSTLTATNSTIELNQISAKGTISGQEIGYGTFNVNFADSEVVLANRLQIQEQETANVNFNFTENSSLTGVKHFSNFSTKGTVTFDNSTAEITENFANIGTVKVQNNAVVDVTYGGTNGLVLGANGAYAEKQNGNSGTISINGADMVLTSTGTLAAFTNSGTIEIFNGTLTIDNLINNGGITLNETGLLAITTLDGAAGTITVNVTDGWMGVGVLVNAAAGTSADKFGAISVDAADAAAGVKFHVDEATGDLVVYNVDTTTVYVNSAWNYAFGYEIEPGKYFGINAYDEMDEVAALAASDSSISVIQGIAGSQVSLHVDVTTANPNGLLVNMGSNGISFDKNGAYTLNGSTDFDTASAVGAEIGWTENDITIGENVTVNADVLVNTDNALRNIEGVLNVNGVMVRSADKADLIVSGELNVADNFVVTKGGDGGKTTVEKDGKLTVNSIWNKAESFDFNINGNASVENFSSVGNVNVSGTLDLKKGISDIASLNAAGTVNVTAGADVTLGDALVDAEGSVVLTASNMSVSGSLENGGAVSLTGGTLTAGEFANSGAVELDTGSRLTVTGTFSNAGTVGIHGGIVEAADVTEIFSEGSVAVDSEASFSGGIINNCGSVTVDGSTLNAGTVVNSGSVEITNSSFSAGSVDNTGKITVSGNSTLNITTVNNGKLSWDSAKAECYTIVLNDAVISDSSVGGYVDVAGNVTFRGDNTFGTIQDFEVAYQLDNNAVNKSQMTVEAGASVVLTGQKFGIGYGDKITVNGELTDAKAAYAAGTPGKLAFDAQKGVYLQANRSGDVNTFDINDAYVRLGNKDNHFMNNKKSESLCGTYNFTWNNAVVTAEAAFRILDSGNDDGKYNFILTDSVFSIGSVYADANQPAYTHYSGLFQFSDKDSSFKATDSIVVSIGNDSDQINAGTLDFDNSTLEFNSTFINEAGGKVEFSGENALLTAPVVVNSGKIDLTGGANITVDYFLSTLLDISYYDGDKFPENFTVVAKDSNGNEIGRTLISTNGGKDTVASFAGASYEFLAENGVDPFRAAVTVNAETRCAGEIVLDEASVITVNKGFDNAGTITVNVTDGWKGVGVLVDAAAGTSADRFGTISIDAADAAAGVKFRVDEATGDLVVYNVDTTTIYVNSAWRNYAFGYEIEPGKYFDINAFNTFSGEVAAEDTVKMVVYGGTYSSLYNTVEDVSVIGGNVAAVEAVGEVVVDVGSLVFETAYEGVVTVTGNFTTTDINTYNNELKIMPYYNGAIQFKGTENTEFRLDGNFNAAEGFTFDAGKAVISEDSVLTVNDQHCGQINVYGNVENYGTMTVDLQIGSTLRLVNIENGGSLTVSGENASLSTNIVNDQPWAGAQCVDFYIADGVLSVEDRAAVEATGIVDIFNAGSVAVSGGASFAGGEINLKSFVKLTGFTPGEARTVSVAFVPADDSDAGTTLNVSIGENAVDTQVDTTGLSEGNYNVTIVDGADNIYKLSVTVEQGKMYLAGGNVEADVLNIGYSTVKMDALSTITAEEIIISDDQKGNGRIDIAIEDHLDSIPMYKKLIDITGRGDLNNDCITIDGKAFNGELVCGESTVIRYTNDLYLINAVRDCLYVGTEYDGFADFSLVNDKVVGFNAFDDMEDLKETLTDACTDIVFTAGNTESYGDLAVNQDITLHMTGEGSVKLGLFDDASAEAKANTVTVAEGADIVFAGSSVKAEDKVVVEGKVTFDGSVANAGTIEVKGGTLETNKLTNTGIVNVTGESTVEIGTLSGVINADNAILTGSITGGALSVTGESSIGAGFAAASLAFGTLDKTVDADINLDGLARADFAAQNGTVDITGRMDAAGFGLAQFRVSGNYNTADGQIKQGDLAAGSTIVNVGSAADTDVYVKAHQVYISETDAVNKHKLNVWGTLEATNSIYNKSNGELNVYGTASANYLQVAGNVTVTGEGAELTLAGSGSNGAAKVGLADGSSKFVISNGAKLDADGIVSVGYSDRSGEMIVENATVDASAGIAVADGSTFTVKGASTVKAAVTGTLTLADDVVISADSVITVDGNVNALGDLKWTTANGQMAVNGNITVEGDLDIASGVQFAGNDIWTVKGDLALSGTGFDAASLTVNGDMYVSDIVISGDTVTVYEGAVSLGGGLFINGEEVDSGNRIVFNDTMYQVNVGAAGITLTSPAENYTPISAQIVDIKQTAGKYEFTVDAAVADGFEGYGYTLNVTDKLGNALDAEYSGLTFTLNEIATDIVVTLTVTDKYGDLTAVTTGAFEKAVTDCSAPVFTVGPSAAAVDGKLVLSWTAFDTFGISDYIVTINGKETKTGFNFEEVEISRPLVNGKNTYTIVAIDNNGFSTEVSGSLNYKAPAGNIAGNSVAQIVGFDEKRRAVGYIANEGVEAPIWKGIWDWDDNSGMRAVATGHFAGTDVSHSGLLFYNEKTFAFGAWTDITDSSYGYVELGNAGSAVEVEAIGNFDGNFCDDILVEKEDGSIGIMTDVKGYVAVTTGDSADLAGAGYFGAESGVDSLVIEKNGEFQLWSSDDIASGNWTATKIMDADNQQLLDITGNWEVAGIGDFKGDGIDDIIMTDEKGYSFLLNDGKTDSVEWAGAISSDFEVAGVGDYNGDGCEDLLLREMTTGWGGLGYWNGGNAGAWIDLNARIETSDEPGHSGKFSVITVTK